MEVGGSKLEVTAAQALVQALEQENIPIVFGYPGGSTLPVYDVLASSAIKHVLVRHEQGAVFAANGYARATGRVGVCIATSGPGATNLVTGIADAYMDSVPLVIFTGQVPTTQVGTDAFQEVDITGITVPITKHNYLVKDHRKLLQTIKNAFYIAATGRPGPVLIDLPQDILKNKISFRYPKNISLQSYKPVLEGHFGKINEAARLINKSRRPVIYAGGGILISQACEELKQLAEIISAPVTNTFRGLSCIPGEHPLFLGMLGLHGTRYANLAVTECDLLIALGVRFDDRVTGKVASFAPEAKIIHVDIDPAEIGKNVRIQVPIVGDVKVVLQALLPLLKKTDRAAWLQRIEELKKLYPLFYHQENVLKPQFVLEELCRLTDGEAVIATDVGQHQMWTAQYYRFKKPGAIISSGGLGAMGFGLPAAIGAQLGLPGEKVILVTGDGSFQMTMSELATMVEQKLPLKIFILNNQTLGMVRQLQEFYYDKRYFGVNFEFIPDFVVLAKAYGIPGYNIRTPDKLTEQLPEILNAPGPVLVNCLIDPLENVLPMALNGQNF